MLRRIPNLWRANEDAQRLYLIYLSRLQAKNLHEEVVWTCRRIRHFAKTTKSASAGLFTYPVEIDSLFELGKFKMAWRQLRQREMMLFGKRLDRARHRWSRDDWWMLTFDYAPLLYFLGRYSLGYQLLETALSLCLQEMQGRGSYEVLHFLYNGDRVPQSGPRVTLAHFYGKIGRHLNEWQSWEPFVNGLHPKLLRLSGTKRADLLERPSLLKVLFNKLTTIRAQRITCGVTRGQADLLESKAKVAKWQRATQRARRHFEEHVLPRAREETEKKLQSLFTDLPKQPA